MYKAEEMMLSKLVKKATRTVELASTSVDFIRTIVNVSIAFKRSKIAKFVATLIVDIVNDILGFEYLMKLSTQSYYR